LVKVDFLYHFFWKRKQSFVFYVIFDGKESFVGRLKLLFLVVDGIQNVFLFDV